MDIAELVRQQGRVPAPVVIRAVLPHVLAERDPAARDDALHQLAEEIGYEYPALHAVLLRWVDHTEASAPGPTTRPPRWRPTTYRGIAMRSRLEATFAANLDRVGISWEYEPRAYAAPGMRQWLPDFRLQLTSRITVGGLVGDQTIAYVDVKGSLRGRESEGGRQGVRRRRLMTRMSVLWESEPDALLVIAEDEATEANPAGRLLWVGSRAAWQLGAVMVCPRCRRSALVPESLLDIAKSSCCEKPAMDAVGLFSRGGRHG